jgi:P-type E1-E2 ATPase
MNRLSGITFALPGENPIEIRHVALDFNGTLALKGSLLPGVTERIVRLGELVDIFVLTGDTYGTAEQMLKGLPISLHTAGFGDEKSKFVKTLENTAAIGNGRNDIQMFKDSRIGIAILGPEGLCADLIAVADIVCLNIQDALDLLLEPKRLTATLRK